MAEARRLLADHPRDAELVELVGRLRARAFAPPAPLTLPSGSPAAVALALRQRTPDELAALAEALVTTPDPATDRAAAEAALELFLRVPRERERAERLLTALESRGLGREAVGRARLRLALATGADPTTLEGTLTALEGSPEALAEGLSRLATAALSGLAERPLGVDELVPVAEGAHVANVALALTRRPALRDELPTVARWLGAATERGQCPLMEAERADRAGDHERATQLYASHLADPERQAVLDARTRLLGPPLADAPSSEAEALLRAHAPTLLDPPALPRSGLADRIVLDPLVAADGATTGAPPEAAGLLGASLRERLGDLANAARIYLALALSDSSKIEASAQAVRLRHHLSQPQRASLAAALGRDPALRDERALARSPELLQRALLLALLSPERWSLVRLASLPRPPAPKTPAATGPAPTDPHHPDNRLAAASDLLAAGKHEPAANILAALMRKFDEATPARLFVVFAQALEAEEPVDELLNAAKRALADDLRAPGLLAALRENESAAFAVHEDLIALAVDPARPDELRLLALEAWLRIWRATETPPDPDSLKRLREEEPTLLAAAAAQLGGLPDPVASVKRFLATHPPRLTPPQAFSEALLAFSLGVS